MLPVGKPAVTMVKNRSVMQRYLCAINVLATADAHSTRGQPRKGGLLPD